MRHDKEQYADDLTEHTRFHAGISSTHHALDKTITSSTMAANTRGNSSIKDSSQNLTVNIAEFRKEIEFPQPPSSRPGHALELGVHHPRRISSKTELPLAAVVPLHPKHTQASNDLRDNYPIHQGCQPSIRSDSQHVPRSQSRLYAPQPSQPRPLILFNDAIEPPQTPTVSWHSSASVEDSAPKRMQSVNLANQCFRAFDLADVSRKPSAGTSHDLEPTSSSSSYSPSITSSSMLGLSRNTSHLGGISCDATRNSENKNHLLSQSDAKAEILRRLCEKNDILAGKVSPSKKGFLSRMTTPSPKPINGYSQESLTEVLEAVAMEGSLPLVMAVIALGADPIYRSSGRLKKVRHDALEKATSQGHASVVDYLLKKGANYGEPIKGSSWTSMEHALLTAAYKGHADLVICLVNSHGANPLVDQWPREMFETQRYWVENRVRISKSSMFDGISKWKDVYEGLRVLKRITRHPLFDPTAFVSAVFDNKSELQSAEFENRPWKITYQYSALSCFVRAGWTDAVEEMLSINGSPASYEKGDEVLQYQEKITRYVSPVSALTKETWKERPEDAIRILKLLIDRGFNPSLSQRTATDMGRTTAIGRALAADAAQGVELILQTNGHLAREEVFFRRNKKGIKALPFAAALSLDSLETAHVLLRAGANPRDPAFEDMNVLQFTAYHDNDTCKAMLVELLGLAPELTYDALNYAIRGNNKDAVCILLDKISASMLHGQVAALPPAYDMILLCSPPTTPDSETRYLDVIDMITKWDAENALPRPQLPAILFAIRRDNYVGMQKLFTLGLVNGKSLAFNSKAQPPGF
ncbi:Ank-2 domain containing protein [Pyrenophora tritici-repentis]|uniref:Uncharacterized protein n=1 Tax=Pyrenophora tritici-repentis (strain Pt-1C-BFP) TaxID=426418 RepID=B2VX58_PYRTR|nr:uncharacterized protein PTRG_03104 [Pyrenophora tritici-repentis Pt-1C-BFP]EDU45627.1 predicted protein [Pyrenophora tritici-repentis Pt-1C-BFP]KAG9386163.1 Ank-2 domain containing protein [Pyrenophora tritici-repentis]